MKIVELIFSGGDTDNQEQVYFLSGTPTKNYIFQNYCFEKYYKQLN